MSAASPAGSVAIAAPMVELYQYRAAIVVLFRMSAASAALAVAFASPMVEFYQYRGLSC